MNPRNIKSITRVVAVMMLLALMAGLTPGAVVPAYAAPNDITRASVDSSGAQANANSFRGQISADGRYMAFVSGATNLITDDTNNSDDIFVKDRQTGATTRVSVASQTGEQANNGSGVAAISSDGRYVAFYSDASNLVSGDTNGIGDIFVRDRQTGLTTRVSIDSSGHEANGESSDHYLAISGDGRYVAFLSEATNLVSGDTNNVKDTFVYDRQTSQTRRVSIASNGAEANASSLAMDISDDGRYVTFSSGATNLVAGDTNGARDVFMYDLQTGETTLVSVSTSGEQANGGGNEPAISGDGRYVVFISSSSNLSPEGDYYGGEMVYVRDRQIGQTTLASVHSDGFILVPGLADQPTISRDGRYVAFSFYDKGDNNGILHVWVRDLQTGISTMVEGRDGSGFPSLSADGKFVAFNSGSSNLVSGDTNGVSDVFVREVAYGPDRIPTVVSITPTCGLIYNYCPNPTPSSVSFIVIFSEQVTGVGVDDFSLDMLEGITGASITGVSGYGLQYYVTVNTGTGDGKLRLNIVDNDSIQDTTFNPLGGAGAGNGDFAGHLYWIEKNPPVVTSIVRVDPSPTAAAEVRFTVTFSEEVYPVELSDFVLSTTGSISGAAVTAVSPWEDGQQHKIRSIYIVTVNTGSGDGTLRLDLVDDDSIRDGIDNPLGGAGAGNGDFTTGETYTINKSMPPSPPVVTGIVRTDPNPTSAASVNFTVNFSEAVNSVDSGDFSLTTTGNISGALVSNVSGSGNTYTVTVGTGSGNGDLRLDVVDNDSILNASGSPLGGLGAGNGNFTSGETYTIGSSTPGAPSVTSSLRSDANPTVAASVNFTVTFSETVSGVDAGDFSLSTTGNISGALVTNVSGSGSTYTVTVGTGSGAGDLRLDVVDNDSILNASNFPLGGPGAGNGNFISGEAYTINRTDNPAPTVTGSLLTGGNPTNTDSVHFNVTFSEAVSGVDVSDFTPVITGNISGAVVANVSGAGTAYTVTVNTGTGDGTIRLDVLDNDSIVDGIFNPLGGAGLGNGNYTLGEAYTINKGTPVVLSILCVDPSPIIANSVRFNVTFSEPVINVDVDDFVLTRTGNLSVYISDISSSANIYTVTVSTSSGTGSGTLRLDLIDNDSIMNSATRPLGGVGVGNGSFTTGEVYTIAIAPTILSADYRSTGSSDGWVLESSENSNVGGSKNSAATVFKLGDDAQDRQFRSILHFPTYYLPDNAVVTQAILMIKKQDVVGTNPFNTHQNISIDIRKGYFSNFNLFNFGSLQLTDFQATADMYMVGTIQNNPVGGWYWATLDSRAFPYINLKDATQLRLAFQLDDNDDMGDDYIRFYSGDYVPQTDRPHLLVDYYVPR